MNNSELERILKAAPEPVLDETYREIFAQTVWQNLRSAPPVSAPAKPPRRPRLVWKFALAACFLTGIGVGVWRMQSRSEKDVLADARLVQETLTMFPNRVRAIVRDEHGLKLVLADQPDVPASTPIYVRICDGAHCSSLVTFSGQEIQIAGQRLMVLSQPDGGIILEGNEFVWSSTDRNFVNKGLKIEAKALHPATL